MPVKVHGVPPGSTYGINVCCGQVSQADEIAGADLLTSYSSAIMAAFDWDDHSKKGWPATAVSLFKPNPNRGLTTGGVSVKFICIGPENALRAPPIQSY